jgi:hypothetical protein
MQFGCRYCLCPTNGWKEYSMIESSRRAGFLLKASQPIRGTGKNWGQDFDRDFADLTTDFPACGCDLIHSTPEFASEQFLSVFARLRGNHQTATAPTPNPAKNAHFVSLSTSN